MIRTLKLTMALLTLLAASMARSDTLSGATLEWPPFTSSALNAGGVVSDIVTQVFARAGHDLEIKFLPWDRVLNETKAGNIDVLVGLWYSEERNRDYVISEPLLMNRIVFIKPQGDSFEYTGLESLTGKKVGIVRNYTYSDDFNAASNFKKLATGSLESNLKKLAAKRIDLTLEDEIVARHLINTKLPELKDRLAFTPQAMDEQGIRVAISRANPDAERLIAAFNRDLAAYKADGSYQRAIQQHGL